MFYFPWELWHQFGIISFLLVIFLVCFLIFSTRFFLIFYSFFCCFFSYHFLNKTAIAKHISAISYSINDIWGLNTIFFPFEINEFSDSCLKNHRGSDMNSLAFNNFVCNPNSYQSIAEKTVRCRVIAKITFIARLPLSHLQFFSVISFSLYNIRIHLCDTRHLHHLFNLSSFRNFGVCMFWSPMTLLWVKLLASFVFI